MTRTVFNIILGACKSLYRLAIMMFAKDKAFNQVETTLCKLEETHSSWSNDSDERPVFAKTDMGEFREPQDSYKEPCQHAQDNKPGRDKNNDSDYVVKQNDDYTHISQSRKIRETPVQPLLDTRTKSQNSIGGAGRNNVVKQNDDYTHISQSRKIRETPVQPLLDTRTKSQNSISGAGRNNVDPKSLALPRSHNNAVKTKNQ